MFVSYNLEQQNKINLIKSIDQVDCNIYFANFNKLSMIVNEVECVDLTDNGQMKKNFHQQSRNYYQHNLANSNLILHSKLDLQKFQSSQLPRSIQKKISPSKTSLPIKEFQYGTKSPQTKKRTQSQSKLLDRAEINLFKENLKLQRMPIKIIKDKLQHEQNIKLKPSQNNSPKTVRQSTQNKQNPGDFSKFQKSHHHNLLSMKNFTFTAIASQFKERQKAFQPKLSIFERYNYQNYQNYSYKNPYKLHQPYSVVSRNQQSNKFKSPIDKYQPHKGQQKNIQIIFCETKYPKFVQKTNQAYEKFNQNKSQRISKEQFMSKNQGWGSQKKLKHSKSIKKVQHTITNPITIDSRNLMNTKNNSLLNHESIKAQPQKINCVHTHSKILNNQNINSKSTLQKLLKQFKTLQKLTLLQQKQQQTLTLNRLRTEKLSGDHSKTVLISLLQQKFPFIGNLSKSIRNNLFRSVFEEEVINQSSKISIYDFMKLNRIFVSKDASLQQFSVFLIRFLFKSSMSPSIEVAERIVSQLNPNNKQKLQSFMGFLHSFKNDIQTRYETIIAKFISQPQWMITVIQLIKNE